MLKALFGPALVTVAPIFTAIIRSTFVPPLWPRFRTAFMPLVPSFWLALRLRFFTRFRRGFYGLLLFTAISGCLILCAAIRKTVTSASSTAAAAAPLARAFPFLFLRSTLFGGRALC